MDDFERRGEGYTGPDGLPTETLVRSGSPQEPFRISEHVRVVPETGRYDRFHGRVTAGPRDGSKSGSADAI